MALVLPHSVFFHIPKTGGSWVRTVIKELKIPTREIGEGRTETHRSHCFPSQVDKAELKNRFVFTFVRDPLTWYQSRWAYSMETGWNPEDMFDLRCASNDFLTFIQNCISHYPKCGFVSRTYAFYTASPAHPFDFIGRQENLTEDLITALHMAGEEFDEEIVRSVPRVNQTNALLDWKSSAEYTEALKVKVQQVEREAIKRFGYA